MAAISSSSCLIEELKSRGPFNDLSSLARRWRCAFRSSKTLDSQKEAVNFAISFDEPHQRTVQLHLPGGDIAELPIIEQMYAQHQKNK
jgi:hypothetical protein